VVVQKLYVGAYVEQQLLIGQTSVHQLGEWFTAGNCVVQQLGEWFTAGNCVVQQLGEWLYSSLQLEVVLYMRRVRSTCTVFKLLII